MNPSFLKSMAIISIYSARIGSVLVTIMLFSLLYHKIFKPVQAPQNRLDVKLHFITRRNFLNMGRIVLVLFAFHAFCMGFLVILKGNHPFPYFGFVSLVFFLFSGFFGLSFYFKEKSPEFTLAKKKKEKRVFIVFVFLAIIAFFFHMYEVNVERIIKPVKQANAMQG